MQQQMVPHNQADAQLEVQHQQQQQRLANEPPPPPPCPLIVHRQQQVQQPLAIENPVLPVATAPAPTPLAAVSIADHQQQEQHQAYILQTPVVSVAHSAPVVRHQQLQQQQNLALAPKQEQLIIEQQQQNELLTDNMQQQIQVVIADPDASNGAVGRSTPKSTETVNLNLIVDEIPNVQNEVMVKGEEQSVERDISALARDINVKLNDNKGIDDYDDGDILDLDVVGMNDDDEDKNKVGKLSDEEVLCLPLQYLKPEDLAHCKKLQH